MWIKTVDNKIINTKFILKLYLRQKSKSIPSRHGLDITMYNNVYEIVCILINNSEEILCECDSLEKANNQLNKFQIAWNDN